MIKPVHAANLTRWTLVSVFGLFGLFPGAASHWRSWLSEHALLDGLMSSGWLVVADGSLFVSHRGASGSLGLSSGSGSS